MRQAAGWWRLGGAVLALAALGAPLVSCESGIAPEDMELAQQARVRTYFNFTGTESNNGLDPEVDNMLIQMIDRAQVSVDFAIMGFSRTPIIDALVRAHLRGVQLRFVGDSRHMESGTRGYLVMDRYNIPMMVGNQFHIMHNKFFIIDDRFVVTGTGNITTTGYEKNDNNYVIIDDPHVARDFKDEFEQMFEGRFGANKTVIENGNTYQLGDTRLEVRFSPQEDCMGRLLQGIEEAQESVYFMIFAFTKDQVGSALIAKHLEFERYNVCCDPGRTQERLRDPELKATCEASVVCAAPFRQKEVRGVIDRSQLHSNGPYHEAYRLIQAGVRMRLDGNDNSFLPGDYQAGGGRMHSKTLIVDPGIDSATVLTGSFNWSSSATQANDETFLVLQGRRVTDEHKVWWDAKWDNAKAFGNDWIGRTDYLEPGAIVFNEIHWDGYNGEVDGSDFGGDDVSNDEFIELLNTTPYPIDLSMWVIATKVDFTLGFYPGTIIGPYERFLVLDHNIEPYSDLDPQEGISAFWGGDFVMNTANDQRFLRLNLRNAAFYLRLIDPRGAVMDEVGDGGPPFEGGRLNVYGPNPPSCSSAAGCSLGGECRFGECVLLQTRSMERVHPLKPGTDPDAWKACEAEEGGAHVNAPYRSVVLATPGEPNSIGDEYPAEEPDFRAPTE